jgi:hypothetical protein
VRELNSQLHVVDEDVYDRTSFILTGQFDFMEYLKAVPQFKYNGVFDDVIITMDGKTEYLIKDDEAISHNERFLYLRLKEALNFQVSDGTFFVISNSNYINAPGYLGDIISDSAGRPSYAFHTGTVAPGLRLSFGEDFYRITMRGGFPLVYDSSIDRVGFALSAAVSMYPFSGLSLTGGMGWNSLDYSLSSGNITDVDKFSFSLAAQYRLDSFVVGADWAGKLSQGSRETDKRGIKLGLTGLGRWSVFVDLTYEYDVVREDAITEYGMTLDYSSEAWGFWIRGMHYAFERVQYDDDPGVKGWGARCALVLKF